MVNRVYVFMLACLVFLPLPALASEYVCPEDKKEDQQVSCVPHGWLSSTLTSNIPQSDMLTVFDGPPGEMASLVPDNEGATENAFWTFPAEKERPLWIQCGYAGSTTYLSRPLPDSTVKCTQTAAHTISCE
jgi:hypothetical protein